MNIYIFKSAFEKKIKVFNFYLHEKIKIEE